MLIIHVLIILRNYPRKIWFYPGIDHDKKINIF